jgi:Zn-dependent M28 family amino/carboxypeptidase
MSAGWESGRSFQARPMETGSAPPPGANPARSIARVSIAKVEVHTVMTKFFFLLLLGTTVAAAGDRPGTPDIRAGSIGAHVDFLAHDLLEGRAPGHRGGDLAAEYIATQFRLAGLKPGNGDSYFQQVPMVGITVDPAVRLRLAVGGKEEADLTYREDFVAAAGVEQERIVLSDLDLVFVGYGITAPEVPWDDYKGVDVKGKVLLMLVNDPPSDDPGFFGGKALTYYGRWTYKYEEAARQGAAGAIIIHNTEMAGYPWTVVQSSWTGEQFGLPAAEPTGLLMQAWVQQDHADQWFRRIGLDFEKALQMAAKPDFQPVDMKLQVSAELNASLRRIESPNVVAVLEGTDPGLKNEFIIITTHYDHLGVDPSIEGNSIYNGALDNASGTAGMLELARAMAADAVKPRRSVLFAAVTAEEQGLLGSKFYAENPLFPLSRTVANVNIDAINVWGRTENMIAMGAERSSIEDVTNKVARELKVELSPDPSPEKGSFFRSDQFSLVKVGVPAVYIRYGLHFEGKPRGWGEEMVEQYTARHYHQPTDEVQDDWTYEGSVQMMEFVYRTVFYLGNQEGIPEWKPGDPFERARKASFEEGR